MSGSFAAHAAWGLCVIVAFIGWGGGIAAALFRGRPIEAGLRAAWGMSFAILIGGVSCLFHFASRAMVVAFVATGIVLAIIFALRGRRLPRIDLSAAAAHLKKYPGSTLLLAFCALAATIQYLGSICRVRFSPNDDYIAYFGFARQILEQGTFFDPFSTRRVMSFGGQSLLHAIVLAGAPSFRLHLLDQGICLVVAVLLVTGAAYRERKGQQLPWPVIAALIVLLAMPDIRINIHTHISGLVVFLGLYRTLVWLDDAGGRPVANAAVVALLASAACTLRANFIAVVVPMVGLSCAILIWKSDARGPRVREAAWVVLFTFAFLLPWMAMSYISSGTPLFPLVRGNYNDAFMMMQNPSNVGEQLIMLVRNVREARVLLPFPLFFIAGLLLPDRSPRQPLRTLLIAGLIGWIALVHVLISDGNSFERYVFGFFVAAGLAVILRVATPGHRFAQALIVIGVAAQIFLTGSRAIGHYEPELSKIIQMARVRIRSPEQWPDAKGYRALQARVPEREKLLVMVDYPFLFDFARNPIYNVDTAAAVSPPPGYPYFRGPEAAAAYLRGQSIRYIAFTRSEEAVTLYRRDTWERELAGGFFIWRAHAPFYIDVIDNFASLSTSRKRVYEDKDLVLVDLATPAAVRQSALKAN